MAGDIVTISSNLMRSIVDLLVIMSGDAHGILQGTHEAVVVEAQGAQIGPGGFSHITNMQDTLRVLIARETAVQSALGDLSRFSPAAATRIRAILNPMLTQSTAYRQAMQQTEQMAIELQRTDGTRLQGVVFGQGGSGPEIGRTVKALCSTQMNDRSREFAARGIEPRIIPAARASGQQVIATIRTLPMAIRDAADKVVAVIGAMRLALTQAARAALVSGRVVLSAALNTVEAALVRAGSRLSTPIIVINIRELKRAAGIFDPDDGA
jgi:hypothetical protein